MAIKSERQRAWVNSPEGLKALGPERVAAWNKEAEGKELPHRAAAKPKAEPKKTEKKTQQLKGTFSSGIKWV